MPDAPTWTWGSERFWCDETLNLLVALSDRYVAAQGHGHLLVWSRPDGALVCRLKVFARWTVGRFDDAAGLLHLVAPDGSRKALSLSDGTFGPSDSGPEAQWSQAGGVATVRWPTGESLAASLPGELIKRVSCSLDPPRAAVATVFRCHVFDGRSGAVLQVFEGCGEGVLSPGGREVALCDWRGSRVFFADVETGVRRGTEDLLGPISAISPSPDGRLLAVTSATEVRVLDARTREARYAFPGSAEHVAWSADGARLLLFQGGAFIRRDATGEERIRLPLDPTVRRVSAASFATDDAGARVVLTLVRYPGGLCLEPPTEALVLRSEDGSTLAKVPLDDRPAPTLSRDGTRLALKGVDGAAIYRLDEVGATWVETVPGERWRGFEPNLFLTVWSDDALEVRRIEAGEEVARRSFPGASACSVQEQAGRVAVAIVNQVHVLDTALQTIAVIDPESAIGQGTALALTIDGREVIACQGATLRGYKLK